MTGARTALGLLALAAITASLPARAQLLHSFTGIGDGAYPSGGVVQDATGALYGATSQGGTNKQSPAGTVYKLVPPTSPGGAWTERIIHDFPASSDDGYYPAGDLLLGADGALYGATQGRNRNGYSGGIIFKLAPSLAGTPDGAWTETILATFDAADGEYPEGSLVADAAGALYGLTSRGGGGNYGSVFKLSPPGPGASAWTLATLHAFSSSATDGRSPVGKLAIDAAGNLYGATSGGLVDAVGCFGTGCGTVFELSPPPSGGSAWTETILYTFTDFTKGTAPLAGVTLGGNGVLYGTAEAGGIGTTCAYRCGVVFALAPPATAGAAWRYAVFHNFDGYDGDTPEAGLTLDAAGNLYGSTPIGGERTRAYVYGTGVVFKLAPPANGTGAWTETYRTPADARRGYDFTADVLPGKGALYTTAPYGGAANVGTVLRLGQ